MGASRSVEARQRACRAPGGDCRRLYSLREREWLERWGHARDPHTCTHLSKDRDHAVNGRGHTHTHPTHLYPRIRDRGHKSSSSLRPCHPPPPRPWLATRARGWWRGENDVSLASMPPRPLSLHALVSLLPLQKDEDVRPVSLLATRPPDLSPYVYVPYSRRVPKPSTKIQNSSTTGARTQL